MESLTLARELKRFIKENKIIIMIITFVILALTVGLTLLSPKIQNSLGRPMENPAEEDIPAIFQFYVQYENGESFHNSAIVEEFFFQADVVAQIEAETGVAIQEALDEQWESGFVKTQDDRGVLGVARNGTSLVFTANATLASSEENLAVMQAYFDYLQSGNIPVLEGKDVFILREPENMDYLRAGSIELNEEAPTSNTAFDILLMGGVGLFGGLLAGIMLALFYQLFRKVITYAFSFGWNEEDIYQSYSMTEQSDREQKALQQAVLHPYMEMKVLLAQDELNEEMKNQIFQDKRVNLITDLTAARTDQMNVIVLRDLSELDPMLAMEECILVVNSGHTEKKWYARQRELLKNYDTQIKVIQLIP